MSIFEEYSALPHFLATTRAVKKGDGFWTLNYHYPKGLSPMAMSSFFDSVAPAAEWGFSNLAEVRSPPSFRFLGSYIYQGKSSSRDKLFTKPRCSLIPAPFFFFEWEAQKERVQNIIRRHSNHEYGVSPGALECQLKAAKEIERSLWFEHFRFMYSALSFLSDGEQALSGCDGATLKEMSERVPPPQQNFVDILLGRICLAKDNPIHTDWEPGRLIKELSKHFPLVSFVNEHSVESFLPLWGENEEYLYRRLLPYADREDLSNTLHHIRGVPAGHAGSSSNTCPRLPEQIATDLFGAWNEEHPFYFDFIAASPLRIALRKIGTVLVERELLEEESQVFFLFYDEVLQILRSLEQGETIRTRPAEQARRRRASYYYNAKQLPPTTIGERDGNVGADSIATRLHGVPVYPSGEHLPSMRGLGLGTGKVRGIACWIRDSKDLLSLTPRAILLCQQPPPSWAAFLSRAGGIACVTGGQLSHVAYVARSMKIPCVLGLGEALCACKTGEVIELDSSNGTVLRLSTEGEAVCSL